MSWHHHVEKWTFGFKIHLHHVLFTQFTTTNLLQLKLELTLLVLEMEYSSFGGNTMPADALAHNVTKASAGMVLDV